MTLQYPPDVATCVTRQSIQRYAQAAELKKTTQTVPRFHAEPYFPLQTLRWANESARDTQLTMGRLGHRSKGLPIIMG